MKPKLFFSLLLIFLSLIGYQKYSEFSNLKSIDSYESCAISKGSVIQESYPSTCITSLGSQFIPPIADFNKEGWTKYVSKTCGYSIEYPSDWTGSSAIMGYGAGEISETEDNISLSSVEEGKLPLLSISCNHLSWPNFDSEATNHNGKENIVLSDVIIDSLPARTFSAIYLQGSHSYFSKTYLIFKPDEKGPHIISFSDDAQRSHGLLIDQVLSTFKFTN